MENNLTIFDVADWFLNRESMTHKKLQKLCWYAYSWFIYLNNENSKRIKNKLFSATFRAWVHGPVDNDLYNKYKINGYTPIPKKEHIELTKYDLYSKFLENVYSVYGVLTADELEAQTHEELPWKNARQGFKPWETSQKEINDIDIFEEYSSR